MSNLLHCDIGEVVQYLREQNKVFYADRLSDCLRHSNENLVKLTIENQKLRKELEEMRKERDEARQLFCEDRFHNGKHYRSVGEGLVVCASPREMAADLGWDCFKENTND